MKKNKTVYAVLLVATICIATVLYQGITSGRITETAGFRDVREEQTDQLLIDDEAIAMSGEISISQEDEIAAKKVLEVVNAQRNSAGLASLIWEEELAKVAKTRAQEIEVSFSHNRPDGSEWWTLNSGIMYGENLAKNYKSADAVVNAWMESPTHKANILESGFQSIGVAVFRGKDGIWYWAQEFGY